jgi:hypothetical protein
MERLRELRNRVRSWHRIVLVGAIFLLLGAGAAVRHANQAHGADQNAISLAGVVGLAIGCSMIASALVARLVSTQVFGLNVRDALEALRGASVLSREEQTLTVTLTMNGPDVRVVRKHEFDLVAGGIIPRRLQVSLYTDISLSGGFDCVIEPNDAQLTGADLIEHVRNVEGKAEFSKEYYFVPGRPRHFVFEASGEFSHNDRLIWTVEHISQDFAVRICDNRGAKGGCGVKINHHGRRDIRIHEHPTVDGVEMRFAVPSVVLPFQGFELWWRDVADDASRSAGRGSDIS